MESNHQSKFNIDIRTAIAIGSILVAITSFMNNGSATAKTALTRSAEAASIAKEACAISSANKLDIREVMTDIKYIKTAVDKIPTKV